MADDASCTDRVFCAHYHHAVELIGRRWTGAILRSMLHGFTRFGDLRASVPDMSDRMLSERLKELEAEAIVERRVTASTPVRIEYVLTPKGRALDRAVRTMEAWADEWVAPPSARRPVAPEETGAPEPRRLRVAPDRDWRAW